jgi:uncharacterized protein
MTENTPHSSPIEFPCDFKIKAMGKNDIAFEDVVMSVVKNEFPNIQLSDIARRPSKDAHYTALTITVHATSKQQLDNVYQGLSDAPEVLMAL